MTAAALARTRACAAGARPVERRDLGPVADLIELVFGDRLDPASLRMLREMRSMARLGWVGSILASWLLPQAASNHGYVWEEQGKVVGTTSLMGVEGHPGRHVLANVAVHPAHRRQGIGRSLVRSCIEWSRERGGRILLLQVDRDNPEARALYASLGFRDLATRTTWVRPAGRIAAAPDPQAAVRRRHADEWRAQWSLAQRRYPEGLIWPLPCDAGLFRPSGVGRTLGLDAPMDWVWLEQGAPAGFLAARPAADRRGIRLLLAVESSNPERAEAGLLGRAVYELRELHRPLILDYPAGAEGCDLASLGFRAERTLSWMALEFNALSQAWRR